MTILQAKSLSVAAMVAALAVAGCGSTGSSSSGGASASGSKAADAPLRTGYTCCNLHYEGDWISDSNYQDLAMIPVGTPAAVAAKPGSNRVKVTMDGKPLRLGLDYGRAQMSMDQYIEKTIVTEDPKEKIKTFPPDTQAAIGLGMLMKGMTKEQVLMAVGYPLASENPNLESPVWRYWRNWTDEYQVIWDDNGTVKDLTGAVGTLARVVYTAKK